METLATTPAQPGHHHTLEMTTSYLLTQVASDVYENEPAVKVKVSPHLTWTNALSVISKSLEEVDRGILIFPQRTKERQDAVRKLALSEKSRTLLNIPPGSNASIGHHIRTPFPKDSTPRLPKPGTKESIRELAKKSMEIGSRQPYTLDIRAVITEDTLAMVSGTLQLSGIDRSQLSQCKLTFDNMLWDTGCHSCTITSDVLPEQFIQYLADSENNPYRDALGTRVQVDGYIAFSNSQLYFNCVFTVVPPSIIPNRRSGVILGQHGFINHMLHMEIPRVILESRGETLKDDEWGDISIIEWKDPISGEIQRF